MLLLIGSKKISPLYGKGYNSLFISNIKADPEIVLVICKYSSFDNSINFLLLSITFRSRVTCAKMHIGFLSYIMVIVRKNIYKYNDPRCREVGQINWASDLREIGSSEKYHVVNT